MRTTVRTTTPRDPEHEARTTLAALGTPPTAVTGLGTAATGTEQASTRMLRRLAGETLRQNQTGRQRSAETWQLGQ